QNLGFLYVKIKPKFEFFDFKVSSVYFSSKVVYELFELLQGLRTAGEIKVGSMVLDEVLIDRCVGRRLDPVTGKIYHFKNFLPETDEIKARPTVRADDTEEKEHLYLQIRTIPVRHQLTRYRLTSQVDINIPELNHDMVGMRAVKENWIWIGGSSMLECPRTLRFSLNTATTHYLHLGASCTNANLP
ncbi:Adenylate kinase 5, chloroplastic, partial [Linum perenne]